MPPKKKSDVPAKTRKKFPDISPRSFEHPADKGALAGLRAIPGLSDVLKALAGIFPERGERLMALASCVRVGPQQYPAVHAIAIDTAETLDLPAQPTIFIARDPVANAYTVGIDEPFIMLTTGLLDSYDSEGLRFVIGHEMGHVLSGHAVLRTLLFRLLSLQATITWIPAGALGLRAVIAALREWFRKAELSADRAGLLCVQDPKAALRAHVYMAGGNSLEDIDLPSFLQQADEYLHVDDIRDSIHKLRYVEGMNHPLAVVRAAELQRWAASEDYRAIIGGSYLRRSDEDGKPGSRLGDDLKGAATSYRDSAAESTDPLMGALSTVGEQIAKVGSKIGEGFGKMFRQGTADTDDQAESKAGDKNK